MSENEFYHVRITTRSNRWGDEIKLDLSKEQLTERFLNPYKNGDIITVNGKPIKPDDNLISQSAIHCGRFKKGNIVIPGFRSF